MLYCWRVPPARFDYRSFISHSRRLVLLRSWNGTRPSRQAVRTRRTDRRRRANRRYRWDQDWPAKVRAWKIPNWRLDRRPNRSRNQAVSNWALPRQQERLEGAATNHHQTCSAWRNDSNRPLACLQLHRARSIRSSSDCQSLDQEKSKQIQFSFQQSNFKQIIALFVITFRLRSVAPWAGNRSVTLLLLSARLTDGKCVFHIHNRSSRPLPGR